MVMAMLFRELFGDVAANPPDSPLLADQHARTALRRPPNGGDRGS
jgi:hypothetical protein